MSIEEKGNGAFGEDARRGVLAKKEETDCSSESHDTTRGKKKEEGNTTCMKLQRNRRGGI